MTREQEAEFKKAKEHDHPPGPGGPGRFYNGPKPDMKKTIGRLLKVVGMDYKWHLLITAICIVVASLGQVAGTYALRYLIDDYITPFIGQENPALSGLAMIVGLMGLAYFVNIAATYIYGRLMIAVSQGTMSKLRDQMFEKMEKLPISYFDTNSNGDIMSHFTNDNDTLRQFLGQGLTQVFSAIMTTVSVFISMLTLSWQMTGIVVIMLAFMTWLLMTLGKRSAGYYRKQQHSLGQVNGFIEEMIQGQKVVKVFCHEEECKKNFDALNDELAENAESANILLNIMQPLTGQMGNIIYFLVAVIGALLSVGGLIPLTLGVLASFLTFTKNLIQPVTMLAQQINSVVMAMAGADRIFKLIDEEVEVDEGKVRLVNGRILEDGSFEETSKHTRNWAWKKVEEDGSVVYTPVKGDVRFHDVNFGYVDDKIVLHDMNLFAKPGHKIAFVGHTGAGKTTITNLINRFYDIQEGEITYDGINVKDIRKDDLRHSLGMVLQDTNLFTGTIMENIRYGRLDATDEECIAAAKLANADYFIRHLPNGYDTLIGQGGTTISQGQSQLLSIARAAVEDAPVLILDEATSSIDTRTEKVISEGMDRLMENRTVFVIAHRLSTVQNSNAILVLSDGRVIERGNHEELMDKKGKYYQLYTGTAELA